MKIKNLITKRFILLSLNAVLLGFSANSFAGGFQLFEQNAVNIGDFGAGGAAIAQDASTAYYNPAGMIRIPNQQLVLSGDEIFTDIKFSGTNTWTSPAVPGFAFQQTGSNVQAGNSNFVPALHYVAPLWCDRLVVGFSILSPFGLETSYPQSSVLRYSATETKLRTIDYSPSVGIKLNNQLSIGAGFDAVQLKVNFNTIAGLPINPLDPSGMDTSSRNSGTTWGHGWHGGLLYQPSCTTRIGLAYHSKLNFNLHGTSKFEGPLSGNMTLVSDDLRANLTLPATTTLSYYHDINPCWAIDASVNYTQWDQFNRVLVLHNVQAVTIDPLTQMFIPVKIDVDVPQHFRNTWRAAVGGIYHPIKPLLLRAGIGFDQTPTNTGTRSTRLPDSNRIALAVGGHYQIVKTVGVDLGWTHIFVRDTRVDVAAVTGIQTSTANGNYHNHIDLVGAQLTWDFC